MMTGLLAGASAIVLCVSQASAQTQTKTVKLGPNATMTVMTTVVTNGDITSAGGGCAPVDPQAIMKALGDAGTVTVSGEAKLCPGAMACSPQSGIFMASAMVDTNPVTWLGVATDEVSPDLRAQLSLPEGAGLIVRDVTKESPAEKAGVQVNDILTKLDDQILVNAPQLQTLIRGKKDGDEAALTLVRKGKETKIKAKLIKKAIGEGDSCQPQVINLGSFGLDPAMIAGQLRAAGGSPMVFQKTFTASGTNMLDAADLQKAISEAVSNAMEQMKKETAVPAPSK